MESIEPNDPNDPNDPIKPVPVGWKQARRLSLGRMIAATVVTQK
jgi:hypothetical protein